MLKLAYTAGLIGYGSDEEDEREKKEDSRAGMEVAQTLMKHFVINILIQNTSLILFTSSSTY